MLKELEIVGEMFADADGVLVKVPGEHLYVYAFLLLDAGGRCRYQIDLRKDLVNHH